MLSSRPPIVVILGHVDHGKTSLLDKIRSSQVALKEAGGITQHIGAYHLLVPVGNSQFPVTFLDTPGHAAFSQMRSRGTKVADIAVLVISAVDGVMPQTKEAIGIIQSLKLPCIVAANKIDLGDASLDKLKAQLAENNLIPEDYGGDIPIVPVSAKTGQGIPQLLEMISLVNELHPVQADSDSDISGVVIESSLDKNKGPMGTILIKSGTLKLGSKVYAEAVECKVKSLSDEYERSVSEALPSIPVKVLGFTSVPSIGSVVSLRPQLTTIKTPINSSMNPNLKNSEKLRIILKSDVAGSLEAIQKSLIFPELEIINTSVGEITESDVLNAKSFNARIIGFNLKSKGSVIKLAETEDVIIKTYTIIYELIEDLEKQINILLHPELAEVVLGNAQILAMFEIKGQKIAGSRMEKGNMAVGNLIHVKRNQQTIANAKIKSLQKGKDSVSEVSGNEEFGAVLSPIVEFKVGDMLLSYSKQ